MVELARRALVASLDGGPFEPASSAFSIAVSDQNQELVVELDASRATLRLDVGRLPAGHRWRDGWMLAVVRDDTMLGTLTLAARDLVIESARARVLVQPRLARRELAPELDGAVEHVPVADVACYRYTSQSSARSTTTPVSPPATPSSELTAFAEPTLAETAPWWELDLGKAMYVGSLRIDIQVVPAATRIAIRGYGYVRPDGSPPSDSVVLRATAGQLASHAGRISIAGELAQGVVARFIRVELESDQPVVLAVTAAEVLAAELATDDLTTTLRRSFALFRDRPLVVARDGDAYTPVATYGELWARAMAVARGLAMRLEDPAIADRRCVLVLCLRSRPEWLVADLAGLVRGYVSVPVSPDEPDDRLAFILDRIAATHDTIAVVCEAGDADRLRRIGPTLRVVSVDDDGPDGLSAIERAGAGIDPASVPAPVPRRPDDLYAVLFTSGSTGAPKGAMRTYQTFFAMVASYQIGHSPRHLSFQPLSHLSERMYLPSVLIHGGTIAFSRAQGRSVAGGRALLAARGGAHLLDELRAFEPTTLGTVPRLFEVLHASYRRRLRALIAAEPEASRGELERRALAEARATFGRRIEAISIGSAPVSAEVFGFLKRCFSDIWVSEGYGSTEVGTIATDGAVASQAEVKLVPLPDQSSPRNGEVARGEIWVRSPHAITGYLGDPDATSAAFDTDGFFATGDLGERDAAGKIRVVGRLRNTVKLAHGEFVSAERIETALATCPLVDRIFVHAVAGATGVAALVVPHADALARALSATPGSLETSCADPQAPLRVAAALRAHGTAAGLAAYELPRGVMLSSEPFTLESGLVTANGKLARRALATRYGERLAQLAGDASNRSIDSSGDSGDGEPDRDDTDDDLRRRVARVASRSIGRAIALDELLADAGIDSLASAEILAALSDELGRDVPLAWWFEAATLGELADRLARFADVAAPVTLRELAVADLELPVIAPVSAASSQPPRHVLLTGATGFLGAHLAEALVERGLEVTCLVRVPDDRRGDDAVAAAKLAAALAAREIPSHVATAVHALAGDLAAPSCGLLPATLDALDPPIDTAIHAGAVVSWLAGYPALRLPNVLGTRSLLELAARAPDRAWTMHHVSTISTVPAGGDETTSLDLDAALAGTPYGLSKWIAERHVMRATGFASAVYRPAMIAPHSLRGTGNAEDFVCRYLAGCCELGLYIDRDDAVLDMTPVDFVAAAICALASERPPAPGAAIAYHLANVEHSLSFAGVGRALAKTRSVRPASYAEFRAALAGSRGRLHALSAFFPERFTLGMGPWPHTRTTEALAGIDPALTPRPIDDIYVTRAIDSLDRWQVPRR